MQENKNTRYISSIPKKMLEKFLLKNFSWYYISPLMTPSQWIKLLSIVCCKNTNTHTLGICIPKD